MGTEDTEFVRRKFTITTELDEDLERLAAEHYQGNVSLCIRHAITDHRESLNRDRQLTLKRLSRSMKQIQDELDEVGQAIEVMAENSSDPQRSSTPSQRGASDVEPVMQPDSRKILSVITEADVALRAEDVLERVELPPRIVRQALGRLVDRGYLSTTSDTPPRYQLVRMGDSNGGEPL